MTAVVYRGTVTKGHPVKALTEKLPTRAGRNNQGRITMRHQGGGNKKLYRLVDFKQRELNVPARVEAIEYDPYRTAFIARIIYANGKRSYILAENTMKVGNTVVVGDKAPLKEGNRMALKNIPVGYMVYNIELMPGKGGQMAKSAGSYAQILAHDNNYTTLKMPSGEVRKVMWEGHASLGQVSNPDSALVTIGKAGRSRWLGVRPTVRGSAMSPRDHPHGGGEGRQPIGKPGPRSPWGKPTLGYRTRRNKQTDKYIVRRRSKKSR